MNHIYQVWTYPKLEHLAARLLNLSRVATTPGQTDISVGW